MQTYFKSKPNDVGMQLSWKEIKRTIQKSISQGLLIRMGILSTLLIICRMWLLNSIFISTEEIGEVRHDLNSTIQPDKPLYNSRGEIQKEIIDFIRTDNVLSRMFKKANDRASNYNLVIYNRVAKCGSTTTRLILKGLSQKLNYHFVDAPTNNSSGHNISHTEMSEKVADFKKKIKKTKPILYVRHFYFESWMASLWEKENIKVALVNIIRDPIEHAISQWYYNQTGSEFGLASLAGRGPRITSISELTSINTCVRDQLPFCVNGGTYRIIPYFCGNAPSCKTPGEDGLRQAIKNVEEHYLFVGILEEYEKSLQILETILPKFFTGAGYLFDIKRKALIYSGQTHIKQKPNKATLDFFKSRKSIQYEIKFYEHVKKLFHKKARQFE